MPLSPERIDRLTQRRARLVAHIKDPNGTPLAERRLEWEQELVRIDAELAGEPQIAGTKIDVPLGQLTAKS